jgi:hypothetical protein
MGGTKRLWEEGIEEEVGDYLDGIIPRSKVSEDAEEVYDLDNEDVGFQSLNVRVSVYKQIKRIAKQDNRTIAATVALMVRDTLKSRTIICGDNCGCPEPCEEQLDRLEEQNRIFGGK